MTMALSTRSEILAISTRVETLNLSTRTERMSLYEPPGALPHLPVALLGFNTGAGALADTLANEENVFAARAADDSCVVREFGLVDTETELVTNGTFDTDISGWTLHGSGSIAWDASGGIAVTSTSSAAYAYQAIATVPGRLYAITAELVVDPGNDYIRVGTSPGTNENYSVNNGLSGVRTATFVATANTSYISVGTFTGLTAVWDNISIKAVAIDDVNGRIDDILNYTSATPKLVFGWDGVMRYNAHNMFLNSGTPATQSITVTSGLTYKVLVTGGTTSVALSGAGTGTASDGSPVEITASTTTLTCTVSGSGGTVQVFRSPADETYIETTSAIRWYLPVDWDPATLVTSSTSALIINGVVGVSKTFAYTGNVFTVGADVRAYDSANPETNYLVGKVTAASSGSVTIQVFRSVGSGTISSWKLIQCKGWLVEPAGTNFVTYSNDFSSGTGAWVGTGTASVLQNITGPDGLTSAWTIPSISTSCRVTEQFTVANSTTYTFSAFFKEGVTNWVLIQTVFFTTPGNVGTWFDLATGTIGTVGAGHTASMIYVGDGWYRCSITFTTDASDTTGEIRATVTIGDGSTTCAVNDSIGIWNAQLETGTIATSPIITAGTSLNRLADAPYVAVADIPWDANAGTVTVFGSTPDVTASPQYLWSAGGGSAYFYTRLISPSLFSVVDTSVQATLVAGSTAANTLYGLSSAWAADDFGASLSGATAVTDTSGTVPAISSGIYLGRFPTASSKVPQHLASIKYLQRRIPDAELQSESTL